MTVASNAKRIQLTHRWPSVFQAIARIHVKGDNTKGIIVAEVEASIYWDRMRYLGIEHEQYYLF